ncbi:MAG: hypothetical protein NTV32_03390, partial [Gammaproteobacteria bacterium]|nr:hypothetical protein [Gammaproteobacteria bacterium]
LPGKSKNCLFLMQYSWKITRGRLTPSIRSDSAVYLAISENNIARGSFIKFYIIYMNFVSMFLARFSGLC